jgi:uncharacterized OB-fold protein
MADAVQGSKPDGMLHAYRCAECGWVRFREVGSRLDAMVCARDGVVTAVPTVLSGAGAVVVATQVHYLAQEGSRIPIAGYVRLAEGPLIFAWIHGGAAVRGGAVRCREEQDGSLHCDFTHADAVR